MKKKLLAIFLTVAMIVTLLPTIALADGPTQLTFSFSESFDGTNMTYQIYGQASQAITVQSGPSSPVNIDIIDNAEIIINYTVTDDISKYSATCQIGGGEINMLSPETPVENSITYKFNLVEGIAYTFSFSKLGDQPGGDQPGGDQPGGNQPGGDQPSQRNPQIKSFALDTIELKEKYDGYYDKDGNFHYVVDSNKVKITMEYKFDDGEDFKQVKNETWEEIRKTDTKLPEILNLQVKDTEYTVLPNDFQSDSIVDFEYAITQTRPSPSDFKPVSATVKIITGGDSKNKVAVEKINSLLTDNKLVLNSVEFTNQQDVKAVLDNCLDNVEKPDGINIIGDELSGNLTDGYKVTLKATQKFGRGQKINFDDVEQEICSKQKIEIGFTGAKSEVAKKYVDNLYNDIKTVEVKAEGNYDIYNDGFYVIEDLDLLSLHSFKSYYLNKGNQEVQSQPGQGPVLPTNAIFFSREFRETESIGNANIKAYLTQPVDSRGDDEASSDGYIIARLVIEYDGCVYNIKDNVGVATSRVYYVPKGTEQTPKAYLEAVNNRVKEYGIEKDFWAEGQGSPSVENYQKSKGQVIVPIKSIKNKLNTAENTYYIENNVRHVFIEDDTDNQSKAGYKGIKAASFDIETNAQVSTDSAEVPLDMNLAVDELTNGDKGHDENISKFSLTEGVTINFTLSSAMKGKNITKLEKGKFTAKMPVPKKYYDMQKSGTPFYAYNVEEEKGLPAIIIEEDGKYYATFETTHFSAYTVGVKESPNTGDANNMTLWIIAALGALVLASGVFAYSKKKSRR